MAAHHRPRRRVASPPRVIEALMPPVVTGAIVALVGLNLARVARDSFVKQPAVAGIALGSFGAIAVYHLLRRLSPSAGEAPPPGRHLGSRPSR